MQSQHPDDIIARIEAARAEEPGGAVAFDGDGTLWSGDVGEDFFHALIKLGRFEPSAHEEMKRAALEFRLASTMDAAASDLSREEALGRATALAIELYEAYVTERFPEERICEFMAWACAGWTRDEVTAFASDVVARRPLSARVHREALGILLWAERARIEVFLVSASPRAVVEEAAKAVGIDAGHILAATSVYDGSLMRAAVERPIPYGAGKVTRLRERIGARPLYAAFGDNLFDIALLREARIPVAVRPKPRLLAREAEVPGIVEILRPDSG